MIVINDSDSWLLVRQTDHAAMSARIARDWCRPNAFEPAIWDRFLAAVRRHDDGWINTERSPSLDPDGRPHDFKSIHTTEHVAVWRRSVDLAAEDDPYVALLVALHARWLYTHVDQGTVEEERIAQAFVDQITIRIDEFIGRLSVGSADLCDAVRPPNLAAAQSLLGFFDAFSLALIGGIDRFAATENLPFADRSSRLSISFDHGELHGAAVRLDPWPLKVDRLEVSTRADALPRAPFQDSAQLIAAIRQTSPIELSWTLSRG